MSKPAEEDWRYLPPRPLGSIGPEEYITERMFQYRRWYDDKAGQAKFRFQWMRAISVVGAAIVPVLVNLDFSYQPLVTTLLSLLVVVFVSLESVFHFGDQWKNYRSTEQLLAQEYFYFTSGDGPYKGMKPEEAFLQLVARVEGAIASENASTLKVLTIASKAEQGRSANPPAAG
jgi:hypothetical protein